jgi:hypothetical protein
MRFGKKDFLIMRAQWSFSILARVLMDSAALFDLLVERAVLNSFHACLSQISQLSSLENQGVPFFNNREKYIHN